LPCSHFWVSLMMWWIPTYMVVVLLSVEDRGDQLVFVATASCPLACSASLDIEHTGTPKEGP
jgi:hypothetical protein